MKRSILLLSVLAALLPVCADSFTLVDEHESGIYSSVYRSYVHDGTGFMVVYEENAAGNMRADLAFRTPQQDYGDLNHVFEHSLLSGSARYPSSYLFFDLSNRAYISQANAGTYQGVTDYYIESPSAEQLMKGIDILMSLAEDPDLIRNENIYRREAVRYDLWSPDDDIVPAGTVFNEDMGYISSEPMVMYREIISGLYGDTCAGYYIGQLPLHLEDNAYSRILEIYDEYYRWDNAVLYLYGELDIEAVLDFLDREYLAGSEKVGTDLSVYLEGNPEPGFREKKASLPVPSYIEVSDTSSAIAYAFDISDLTGEERYVLQLIAQYISADGGMLQRAVSGRGIQGRATFLSGGAMTRPMMAFILEYTSPDQALPFKEAIDSMLESLAEEGIPDAELSSYAEAIAASSAYSEEMGSIAADNALKLQASFAATGGICGIRDYESAVLSLAEGGASSAMKVFAALRDEARPSVMVTLSPEPGLLEDIYQGLDDHLAEMKEGMSDEEIAALVENTREYYEWVALSDINHSVGIDRNDIPDFTVSINPEERMEDGVRIVRIPVDAALVYAEIQFGTGDIAPEDKNVLALFPLLLSAIPTETMDTDSIAAAVQDLCMDLDFSLSAGIDGSPVLSVSFYAEPDEAEAAISLVADLLSSSDFTDREAITDVISLEYEDWNPQRIVSNRALMIEIGSSLGSADEAYSIDLYLCGFHDYLIGLLDSYDEALPEKLQRVRERILSRGDISVIIAGDAETIAAADETVMARLSTLPMGSGEMLHAIPELPGRIALITGGTASDLICTIPLSGGIEGRFLPWITAATTMEVLPLRLSGGAYSVLSAVSPRRDAAVVLTASDSRPADSLRTIGGMWKAMVEEGVSDADMNAYALSTMAGMASPRGPLMDAVLQYHLIGDFGEERLLDIMNGPKDSSPEDKEEALRALDEAFASGHILLSGPYDQISTVLDGFDAVIDLR